jgi:hypothetical protein
MVSSGAYILRLKTNPHLAGGSGPTTGVAGDNTEEEVGTPSMSSSPLSSTMILRLLIVLEKATGMQANTRPLYLFHARIRNSSDCAPPNSRNTRHRSNAAQHGRRYVAALSQRCRSDIGAQCNGTSLIACSCVAAALTILPQRWRHHQTRNG